MSNLDNALRTIKEIDKLYEITDVEHILLLQFMMTLKKLGYTNEVAIRMCKITSAILEMTKDDLK